MTQEPIPPNCEHCGKPMQLADSVNDGQDNIVATRYVCFCNDVLKHKNIHAGQAGPNR